MYRYCTTIRGRKEGPGGKKEENGGRNKGRKEQGKGRGRKVEEGRKEGRGKKEGRKVDEGRKVHSFLLPWYRARSRCVGKEGREEYPTKSTLNTVRDASNNGFFHACH